MFSVVGKSPNTNQNATIVIVNSLSTYGSRYKLIASAVEEPLAIIW